LGVYFKKQSFFPTDFFYQFGFIYQLGICFKKQFFFPTDLNHPMDIFEDFHPLGCFYQLEIILFLMLLI